MRDKKRQVDNSDFYLALVDCMCEEDCVYERMYSYGRLKDMPDIYDAEFSMRSLYLCQLYNEGIDDLQALGLYDAVFDIAQLAELLEVVKIEKQYGDEYVDWLNNDILFDSDPFLILEFYNKYMRKHPFANAIRFALLESFDYLLGNDMPIRKKNGKTEAYLSDLDLENFICTKNDGDCYSKDCFFEAVEFCRKFGFKLAYKIESTWYFMDMLGYDEENVFVTSGNINKIISINSINSFYITNVTTSYKNK